MEDYDDIISDHSYDEETCYSDQVDSDIETELYGLVHYDTQQNSVFDQDKSVSVGNNSGSLEDESASIENNSISVQKNLNSNDDNSVLLLTNSFTSEKTNSTKNLKNTFQKNSQNCSTPIENNRKNVFCSDVIENNRKNVFCSDVIVNNNLYYSFETPIQKQNNSKQSQNLKRNKSDMRTKRKSEIVSEILGSIQLKDDKNLKSIQNENNVCKKKKNSHDKSSISNTDTFVEVIDESSDSDSSIIFLEPDQSNLETNILKETVVLSSDSEYSDSSMEKNLSQVCNRKQTTFPNADLRQNDKDLWHINSEDQFRTKKQSNRYHENAVVTCSNCQCKGHSAKFCSIPKDMKCFFCGGCHTGGNCKNKICSKCLNLGHDSRRCYSRYIATCELCQMRGHSERDCPDLWRRYHLTTSKGSIVKGNPNPHSPLYCYTCGSKGHYGAECIEIRRQRWSFPTWTSVISYKNAVPILRNKKRNAQERTEFDRTPSFHRERRNEMFSKDTPKHIRKKKKKKSPKTPPSTNQQSTSRPKNIVKKEVYFPRTPKSMTPGPSIERLSKKLKKKTKSLLKEQVMHQIGLQQRLGLPFPSTV